MNFLIIEQTDGGMDVTDSDMDGVKRYLHGWQGWHRFRDRFIVQKWRPGQWMEYPNGIIVCISGEAIV